MAKNIRKITLISLLLILPGLVLINCLSGSGKRKEELEAREKVMREIKYGRLLACQIIKKYPLLDDEKANLYVNKVGKSIALFAGRSDIEYYFAILDSDSINAYAAPGGYIFITKGAIKQMKNEAELAAVLAHEIGHVNCKHIMNELPPPRETRSFVDRVAALLVSRGAVVSSAFTEVVNKAANVLFNKGLKIADEFEADKYAVYYIVETGYYPNALMDFLDRIRQYKSASKTAIAYNTHPSFEERIEVLKIISEAEQCDLERPKAALRFVNEFKHYGIEENEEILIDDNDDNDDIQKSEEQDLINPE